MRHALIASLLIWMLAPLANTEAQESTSDPTPVTVRVATFNIEDLRTSELVEPYSDRAKQAAEIIQRIRPNIILINEIAYDMPGSPGYDADEGPGANARRLAALLATQLREVWVSTVEAAEVITARD